MAALALPTDAAAVSLWGGSFISRRDQQPEDSKYFHEPGDTDILHHYDSRFYTKTTGYEEKRDVQIHMMRAFLDTMREIGLETWLAHGTLLGWWWNGKVSPHRPDLPVFQLTSLHRNRCSHGIGISTSKYRRQHSTTSARTGMAHIILIQLRCPPRISPQNAHIYLTSTLMLATRIGATE